jgi:hypothetical protein
MRRRALPLLGLAAGLLALSSATPALAAPAKPVVQRCGVPTGGSIDRTLDPPVSIRVCITETDTRTTVTAVISNLTRTRTYRPDIDTNLYWRDSGGDHFQTLKTCTGATVGPSKAIACSAAVNRTAVPYPRWGHAEIRFPGTNFLSWAADTPMIARR